jgi:hypothetical protein
MEPKKDKKAIIVALIIGFIIGLVAGRLYPRPDISSNSAGRDNDGSVIADADNTDKSTTSNADDAINSPNLEVSISNGGAMGDVVVPLPTESSVIVSDQPAGKVVMLDSLELEERSWAVIYEDSRGRPGNILGAHRYMEGAHTNVPVELQRPTSVGGVYYAMIHHNDSDDIFDHTKDRPYTAEDGSPIMVRFFAQ